MNFNTHNLAWCAGFFDGEGCTIIQMKKSGSGQIYIRIGQKEIDLLLKFKVDIGGFGQIYFDEHYDTRNLRKTEIYRLTISKFEHVQQTIILMWKWLGPHKKAQYKKALITHIANIRTPSYSSGAIRHRRNKLIRENRRIQALRDRADGKS